MASRTPDAECALGKFAERVAGRLAFRPRAELVRRFRRRRNQQIDCTGGARGLHRRNYSDATTVRSASWDRGLSSHHRDENRFALRRGRATWSYAEQGRSSNAGFVENVWTKNRHRLPNL